MDASLRTRAEELAAEMAGQAETAEDLSGLMRLMMKAAMERMLDTEMDVHLGRKGTASGETSGGETPAEPTAVPPPTRQGDGEIKGRNQRGQDSLICVLALG